MNNKVVCLNDKFAIWGDVCGNDERFLSMLWKNFAWEMELEKVIHCEIQNKVFEEWKLCNKIKTISLRLTQRKLC